MTTGNLINLVNIESQNQEVTFPNELSDGLQLNAYLYVSIALQYIVYLYIGLVL